MTSFFSPKSKSQNNNRDLLSAENSNQSGYFAGRLGGTGARSKLTKMRKKRPPPINISVERGNVIFASAPPTSQVIYYADPPWSPTIPTTPTTAVCTNSLCRETPMHRFPDHANLRYSLSRALPWSTGTYAPHTPRSPSACFPMAELPATSLKPSFAELETPSTPTRFSFDNGDDLLNSPPDLVPSETRSRASTNGTQSSWNQKPATSKPEKQTKSGSVGRPKSLFDSRLQQLTVTLY